MIDARRSSDETIIKPMTASPLPQVVGPFIPAAEDGDSDAVVNGLAAAQSELQRGESLEALRLLRKAAEDADAEGRDARALTLARAAADLATAVSSSSTPLSAVPSPVPASASVTPAPPQVAAAAVPASAQSSRLKDPALEQLVESGRALRVVIKRSARDEGLYVVRRAGNDPPSFGAREALLVLCDPDDGFFD